MYRALGRDESLTRGRAGVGSQAASAADLMRRRDSLRVQSEIGRLDAIDGASADKLAAITDELATFAAVFEDPSQIVAIWAVISTDGAGGLTLVDSLGIASVSFNGGRVRCFLTRLMGLAYLSFGHHNGFTARGVHGSLLGQTALDVTVWEPAGSVNASTSACDFGFGLLGRRA